jgi:hypothetical protein
MTISGFFCPRTHEPLTISADTLFMTSLAGDRYPIVDGIPALLLNAGHRKRFPKTTHIIARERRSLIAATT